jgi:hypothetical protein
MLYRTLRLVNCPHYSDYRPFAGKTHKSLQTAFTELMALEGAAGFYQHEFAHSYEGPGAKFAPGLKFVSLG